MAISCSGGWSHGRHHSLVVVEWQCQQVVEALLREKYTLCENSLEKARRKWTVVSMVAFVNHATRHERLARTPRSPELLSITRAWFRKPWGSRALRVALCHFFWSREQRGRVACRAPQKRCLPTTTQRVCESIPPWTPGISELRTPIPRRQPSEPPHPTPASLASIRPYVAAHSLVLDRAFRPRSVVAPRARLELATIRLTAGRSTN